MDYFLRRKADFEVKETHLEAAIDPDSTNMGILRLLLSRKGDLPITRALLQTAASKGNQSFLKLLMEQPDTPQPLPEVSELLEKSTMSLDLEESVTFDNILKAASKEAMSGEGSGPFYGCSFLVNYVELSPTNSTMCFRITMDHL